MTDWHIDKRISVGHLLTTVLVAGGVLLWVNDLDSRVKLNEQSIITIQKEMKESEDRIVRRLDQLLGYSQRLDDRINSMLNNPGGP